MTPEEMLYCVNIEDNAGEFSAAAEFLNAAEFDFSSYENKETKKVYHTVYALTEADGRRNFDFLQENIPMWNEYGTDLGAIEYFEMKREDWANVWKKYFNIIHISKRLVIKPSWLEFEPAADQVVIHIDPGMSFGTGQHATTSFCLKMIDKLADDADVRTFLDAGCGSGILTIGAAKLGYEDLHAFDFDPDAVRIAAENLEINGFTGKDVKLTVDDAEVYQAGKQFDLVCANILGHLLVKFKNNIDTWVKPGKYLALAGILNEEFEALAEEFTALGYTEITRQSEKEWTGGLFQKNI